MADFHFLRPAWLLAFIPLLLMLLWLRNGKNSRGVWHAVCDAHLIPYVLETAASHGRARWLALASLAGALAIVALAGPAWQKLPQPVFRQQSALVVMLDLSRSMDAGDVKPSRLERVRLKLQDLLRERREGQTALVVYAGDAFAVTPLTDDTDTIYSLLQSLSTALMPVQGSRPDRAVEQGLALLSQAGIHSGSLLLVTDGVDENRADDIADRVVQAGHRLSVLGTGTRDGAPIPDPGGGFVKDAQGQIVIPVLDERVLIRLAHFGGGVYTPLSIQGDDIERLMRDFEADQHSAGAQSTELHTDRWREEGPWLLLLLLPLASLAFRRGLLLALLAVGIHGPETAQALEWNDLWLNPDQRGMQAMEAQEFGAAAERFSDTRWKAAALYRAGEYEESAAQLEGIADPEAAYNRGNALARAGRYEDAIESYRQTLAQQPDHADARHNLELLEQMQNPQQQQQQSGQGDSEEQEQNQAGEQQSGQQDGGGQDQQKAQGSEQQKDPQQQEQTAGEQSSGGQQHNDEQTASDARESEQSQQEQGARQTGEERKADDQDTQDERNSGREGEEEPGQTAEAEPDPRQSEEQQAMEQWLRRVPDDPGGLLRRKFRYQYTQRHRNTGDEAQAW